MGGVKRFDLVLILSGFCFSLGLSFLLYVTFLVAFFNNGRVLILVNEYNEGLIEFLMLPVVLGVSCYGLYRFVVSHFRIGRPKKDVIK